MDNMVEFRDIVRQQIEEDMQARVGDTIKKKLTNKVGEVQQTINESKEFANSFREEKVEQEAIDSRQCNVILYRMPESRKVLVEERNKQDMSFCEHFFNAFNVGFDREYICTVQRLGKRNEDSPRPVLVQFGSRHIKNLIMESLYKINTIQYSFINDN